jgi:glycosyltransferase involved in cell wall biosynthesis
MKVLLSALSCSPGLGSEPSTGWNWARALADLGHDVTVLVMSNYREAILAAAPPDIDFHFIDIPTSPLPQFTQQLWTADIYRRWQNAALRHVEAKPHKYDVVHHVTWGSLHLSSTLWRLHVPMVYGPIGGGQTAPANYWRYFGRDWPAETLRTAATGPFLKLNRWSRDAVRNSAVTLVCNSATEAASRRLGAADVRYMLADGLRSDWLGSARRKPAGTPVVLWVGRLLPRKAPVLAVQAFAELRRVMPAHLIVAGDGPLRGQLRTTIDRLGVSQDVELLGSVKWDDVRRLYDSASVLLFTSLRESFGAPFLEALGRGMPAVALDLHGIGDADVGPAAIKVDLPARPRDLPGRLASALQAILSDDEWEMRSAAAINWASKWIWPVKASAMTRIYEEIAGRQD